MSDRLWTIFFIGGTALLLIAWDVYVAFFNKTPNDRDTISGIVLGWARKHPVVPFAFGVLMGHLFWSQ